MVPWALILGVARTVPATASVAADLALFLILAIFCFFLIALDLLKALFCFLGELWC